MIPPKVITFEFMSKVIEHIHCEFICPSAKHTHQLRKTNILNQNFLIYYSN